MSVPSGHDDGLPLVDLIACALCCMLLLVFAALASRDGLGGSTTGFAYIALVWEFSGDPKEVNADAELDGRALLTARMGMITPGKDWFAGAERSKGGRWSSSQESIPAINLFAEFPQQSNQNWEVRVLIRDPVRSIQSSQKWTFRGTNRPIRLTARLIDQTTEGRAVERQKMLSMIEPLTVLVNIDMANLNISSEKE